MEIRKSDWFSRALFSVDRTQSRARCSREIVGFGLQSLRSLTVGRISASFGKSSLKHSKSFRIMSSNQKLARALTNTPEAIARTNTSYCLATSGTKTAGSVTSRRSDRAFNWHMFPWLLRVSTKTTRLLAIVFHFNTHVSSRSSRPFLSCPLPQFQNESSRETIQIIKGTQCMQKRWRFTRGL